MSSRFNKMASKVNRHHSKTRIDFICSYPYKEFIAKIELIHSFLNHRISRARGNQLNLSASYESDWKMASAARVMALLCNIS